MGNKARLLAFVALTFFIAGCESQHLAQSNNAPEKRVAAGQSTQTKVATAKPAASKPAKKRIAAKRTRPEPASGERKRVVKPPVFEKTSPPKLARKAPKTTKPKTRKFKAALSEDPEAKYSVVKVHYATDRNRTGLGDFTNFYGAGRSEVSYGICEVSIPRDHRMGQLEAPSMLRLEFREDPNKHVVLRTITEQDQSDFFAAIKNRVNASKGKKAFLFVHGFNVEFHEAARRTAQMAYDLGFDGAPIFYSWPSQGTYSGYPQDEANVLWTQNNIKAFVKDFVSRSNAQNIYLIAHSMGSRGLTRAVAELVSEDPSLKKRFREILLAAPDIDADIFRRDIAPKIIDATHNVTLYASTADRALQASKRFHGQARAGDAGENLIVMKGIDTIDATSVSSSFLGHAYFAEARSILSDIFSIIHYGHRPSQRLALRAIDGAQGRYWAFKKPEAMATTKPDEAKVPASIAVRAR